MTKPFELWTRRLDMTHAKAVRHWTGGHAPLVKKTFGDKIIKYVTNVGLPLDTRGLRPGTNGSGSSTLVRVTEKQKPKGYARSRISG